jgi:hypothetical protein
MEKFIEVYDNVLPSYIVKEIKHLLISGESNEFFWLYRNNLTSKDNESSLPGFAHLFYRANPLFDSSFSTFLNQILYIFCNSQNILLQHIELGRTFLQLPNINPSASSSIHTDLDDPHYVCLYYVNDSDGDTIFFDDNENEIKRVSPKEGRIAFFDGSIKHKGGVNFKGPRAVINFNFIGKRL